MGPKVVLSEQAMQRMEKRIPELAGEAVKRAYLRALSAGGKVVEATDGKLVVTSVDGGQTVIRNLPAPTKVPQGTKRMRARKR